MFFFFFANEVTSLDIFSTVVLEIRIRKERVYFTLISHTTIVGLRHFDVDDALVNVNCLVVIIDNFSKKRLSSNFWRLINKLFLSIYICAGIQTWMAQTKAFIVHKSNLIPIIPCRLIGIALYGGGADAHACIVFVKWYRTEHVGYLWALCLVITFRWVGRYLIPIYSHASAVQLSHI